MFDTYENFLKYVLENGIEKSDRTRTGTLSTFGYQMRFNMKDGFPLITTKKVFFKGILHELLWFIRGETNIRSLNLAGVKIWNEWPYEKYKASKNFKGETLKEFAEKIKNDKSFADQWGELGPVYGKQWRDFSGVDQLAWVQNEIRENPHSRRLIVNAWNAAEIDSMALPPCHMIYQFYVNDGKLSLQLYQRSADAFLGVPFNIASYSLLLLMMAQTTGLEPHEFIHTIGDAHIYKNHIPQVETQIKRVPFTYPTMKLNPEVKDIFHFHPSDFELMGYTSHPRIKGEISV